VRRSRIGKRILQYFQALRPSELYNCDVGKLVPPIPPAAAAAAAEPAAVSIEYATPGYPRPHRRNRAFPILLMISLCYFAGLILFQLLKLSDISRLISEARELPIGEPYTIDFWAYILAFPLMTLIALLPVLAAVRGLRHRSPQGLIILYAMLQILVLVIDWVAALNLVRHGRFSYSNGGGTHIFVVYSGVLRSMPMYQVLFSLPLLGLPALLVRRIRQTFAVPQS
jgi:hypothetical protein